MATHGATLRLGGGVRTSLGRLRGPVLCSRGTPPAWWRLPGAPGRAAERRPVVPFGQIWIGTATTAATLARIDPAVAAAFLSGWALRRPWAALPPNPPRRRGRARRPSRPTRASGSDSSPAFDSPCTTRRGGPRRRCERRRRPGDALVRGARASDGYLPVITPHPSLMAVHGAACGAGRRRALDDGLPALRDPGRGRPLGRHRGGARPVSGERLPAYRDFVAGAAAQARRANPGVSVLSGLSTNFTDDPRVLYAAWRSVTGMVDGHYLNVPHGIRPRWLSGSCGCSP